jgi:hypothetical protein
MKGKPPRSEIELVPDAWTRFEKFIREIVKAGPQHRKPIEKTKVKASTKASRSGKGARPPKVCGVQGKK